MAKTIFDQLKEMIFRDDILNKRRRPDGRRFSEILTDNMRSRLAASRSWISALTRGETQALVSTTLGTKEDEQFMDDLEKGEVKRRFLLHYNFPQYSVGEVDVLVRRVAERLSWSTRAVERSKQCYLTTHISVHTPHSFGHHRIKWSSSMASVCGGTLS